MLKMLLHLYFIDFGKTYLFLTKWARFRVGALVHGSP